MIHTEAPTPVTRDGSFGPEVWQLRLEYLPKFPKAGLDLTKVIGIFVDGGCPRENGCKELRALLDCVEYVPNIDGVHSLLALMKFHQWDVRQFRVSMNRIVTEYKQESEGSLAEKILMRLTIPEARQYLDTSRVEKTIPDLNEKIEAIISSR